MHCANLDTPVKGNMIQKSPRRLPQPDMETKEEENSTIIRTVLDAGILILEGRLPEPSSKRGYVEGPHCVLHPQNQSHQCDVNKYMCKRAEKYRHMMNTIWNEFKGICIELRVCASCSCGEEQVWKSTSSNFDYILEQWHFELTNFRNDEDLGMMNWYGLMQAVRSQIHFSQLSAWWSSNKAQLPKNITYHVLPLIQADVNSCSLQHKFPVLSFTTTYLQVTLRSQPRSETLPDVRCPIHCNEDGVVDDRMKILCDRFGKHHCQAVEDLDENENETWCESHMKFAEAYEKNGDCAGANLHELAKCGAEKNEHLAHGQKKNVKKSAKKCGHGKTMVENDDVRCNGTTKFRTRNERKVEPKMSTFQRSTLNSNNVPFGILNQTDNEKKPLYTPKSDYLTVDEDRIKFDLSASTGRLAEETTTQFFNICNWTNSVVSNVVSKMRNGNSFLNSFPDPNALSEFFLFKNEDKNDDDVERINFDENSRSQQYTNAIASGLANGDTNSKISCLKNKQMYSADGGSMRMDMNSDEMKKNLFKGCYKPVTLHEKNFEEVKLKNFREKRFHFESSSSRKRLLPFVGNVIESILSSRVHFTNCIEHFKIKVTSGGSFSMQNCTDLPAAAYYYHFGDGILSKSYLVKSFIPENEKGIPIPNSGRLQVGIFNTEESLIKVFTVSYDLSDMPRCSKTFLRHSNYFTPKCASENNVKWLQSFLQLKCRCSKSGRLYLQSEINAIMFQKSDLNTACEFKMKTDLMHQDITEIAYKKDLPSLL